MEVTILGRIGYDLCAEELHVTLPAVRTFSRYLGGSSANMATGLARLGARVGMVSCLGEDSLSDFLIEFLRAEKVDTRHIQRVAGYLPSLALTEISPPNHFPQVFYRHDAVDTMLRVTEEDLDYVAGRACSSPTARRCAPRLRGNRHTWRWSGRGARGGAWCSTWTTGRCRGRAGGCRAGGATGAAVHRRTDRESAGVEASGGRGGSG